MTEADPTEPVTGVECGACGTPLPDERMPCPKCGSTRRTVNASGTATAGTDARANAEVERGVNEARMAAFALIVSVDVTVGLSVGYGEASLVAGVIATLAALILTAVLIALIYRVAVVQTIVMEIMHRLTGQ
jgi:preprotein translocase subunit SecD